MVLSGPAFLDGGMIPRAYTRDGENLSPALHWRGVPDGTRSLVLMMDNVLVYWEAACCDTGGGSFFLLRRTDGVWRVEDWAQAWVSWQEGGGART